MREGRAADETVRQILDDPAIADRLTALYRDEIVPGFAARDMGEEAERHVAITLERLRTPFLDHRLADIAQNHPAKVERRVETFLRWIEGCSGAPETLALKALAAADRTSGA